MSALSPEVMARLAELGVPADLKPARIVKLRTAPALLPAPAAESPCRVIALRPQSAPRAAGTALRPVSSANARKLAHELLTRTECNLLGLPTVNDKRAKTGTLHWALVTFADGIEMLCSYYQWAAKVKNDPLSLVPAMASARARYLLILSGGRFIDPAAAEGLPGIVSARFVTDENEREELRVACQTQRKALEEATPGFNPYPALAPDIYSRVYTRRRRRSRGHLTVVQ